MVRPWNHLVSRQLRLSQESHYFSGGSMSTWYTSIALGCGSDTILFIHNISKAINANIEKLNKKRAKQGLPPQKITATANTNVRNIKVNTNNSANVNSKANNTNTASEVTYKKGGIAAKANMVKQYNDKNTK